MTNSWKDRPNEYGSTIVFDASSLSDETLSLYVRIGEGWKGNYPDAWKDRLTLTFNDFFTHVTEKDIRFALCIHIEAGANITLEVVKYVNCFMKGQRHILERHLKGTAIILPNAAVEMIVMTALAINPPVKPLITRSFSGYRGSCNTGWNVPRDMQKEIVKWMVSLAWPGLNCKKK